MLVHVGPKVGTVANLEAAPFVVRHRIDTVNLKGTASARAFAASVLIFSRVSTSRRTVVYYTSSWSDPVGRVGLDLHLRWPCVKEI
jgi:hypothetical protein